MYGDYLMLSMFKLRGAASLYSSSIEMGNQLLSLVIKVTGFSENIRVNLIL